MSSARRASLEGTYLERIVSWHRERARRDDRSVAVLRRAAEAAPPVRSFARALEGEGLSLIAEVKRRSPSRGPLAPGADASELAVLYQQGGASAVSVLTDSEFFGGSLSDLQAVREAIALPLLRKDFVVDERDVLEARAAGADAVLLIVAALEDDELRRFHAVALELGMDVLVEVHDEHELERALELDVRVVGVNQRDLHTFEVDPGRAEMLSELIPPGVLSVVESGIAGPADVERAARAGYDAMLVGETLVTSGDPRSTAEELVSAGRTLSRNAAAD